VWSDGLRTGRTKNRGSTSCRDKRYLSSQTPKHGSSQLESNGCREYIFTYKRLAWLIIVGSRCDDWIYWMSVLQLQLIVNSLYIELLLIVVWISEWSPVSRILDLDLCSLETSIWMSESQTELTSRGPNIDHQVEQLIVLCYFLLPGNVWQSPDNALIYTSVFVAVETCFS
jgi:hypothetical protein